MPKIMKQVLNQIFVFILTATDSSGMHSKIQFTIEQKIMEFLILWAMLVKKNNIDFEIYQRKYKRNSINLKSYELL